MATTSENGSQQKKELDKFKRRMIRAVARLMLHEKMPEQEMWEKLKMETGYDCKLLWGRMRSVALKKLKRMLAAGDHVDVIARMARMTVTDWLLFDLVLVHEKTDFIGTDILRVQQGELKPLTDLFSLVQKFEIEGLSGEKLAEAWTKATLHYNSQGHHVSPMLLQKRWYQLKESTRHCFYQFWFSYRGNARFFAKATVDHTPTMLQMAVARRFNEVVTRPFMEWDEMIQKGLVILSEEFDTRLRPQKKTVDEDAPDLELVEPVIETIELAEDSDTEAPTTEDTQNTGPTETVVKTEPIDEVLEAANNLMNTLAYTDVKVAYESEPDDIEDIDDNDSTLALLDDALDNDDSSPATETENTIPNTYNNDTTPANGVLGPSELSVDNIITTTASNENISVNDKDVTSDACPYKMKSFVLEDNIVQDDRINEPLEAMPQITSVFGNVDMPSDKMSDTNTVQTDLVSTVAISSSDDDDVELLTINEDVDVKPVIPAIEDTAHQTILDEMPADETNSNEIPIREASTLCIDNIIKKSCEKALDKLIGKSLPDACALNTAVEKTAESSSAYGEIHNLLNLADNGVELVDDGIAYVDEEMDYSNKTDKIQSEDDKEADESDGGATEKTTEDTAKIDLKLLLYPVVYTTKLDNMGVLDAPYQSVSDKSLLDTILAKSKPVSKQSVSLYDIKNEKEPVQDCTSDDDDGEAYDNIITNENRVKLSSYLLQKPRTRNYNPIVLCKNPDFNTRLKRLNVGFFSSPRNINLLKHCKPLTVDVSKAFETKLVDGTIYLKPSEEGGRCEVDVTNTDCQQQASVVPTAMPVQSLIDRQKVDPIFTQPISVTSTDKHEEIFIAERSKVINLPDISQVRRLNQRLLTAEVTPIQVKNTVVTPPTIVVDCSRTNNIAISTSSTHFIADDICKTEVVDKCDVVVNENITAARDVVIEDLTHQDVDVKKELDRSKSLDVGGRWRNWRTIAATNTNAGGNSKRYKNLIDPRKKTHVPWKSREARPSVGWLSMIKHKNPPLDDALLTVDALNKMLFLLAQEKDGRDLKDIARKCNKAAAVAKKKGRPRKNPPNQCTQVTVAEASNDDVQVVSDAVEENQPKDNPTKVKQPVQPKIRILVPRIQPCCWAKGKIQAITNEKRMKPHDCLPLPCTCCCKDELLNFIMMRRRNRSLEKACKSIESVVQRTYSMEGGSNTDPKSVSTQTNFNVTLVNKPFRISLDDSSDSDCADNETEGEKVPSPPTEDCINDVNRDDAPPVGAEVSVSSSIVPPSNLLRNIDNPVNMNTQEAVPATNPTPPLVNNPISEPSFPKFRYLSGKPQTPRLPPGPKTYQNSIVPLPSSCKCIVPISVDSPHRKLIIDGSTTCPMHNNIMPKVGSNEKQIYLTSRQISQKPSQSPIYLGKNKILLTNIKFPPELERDIETKPQTPLVKIIPTLPLPTGVQLVLQSNGELTYNVDPSLDLDSQKLEGLPEILEAVKKQLNGMEIVAPNPATITESTQNKEIISLSDDETSEPTNGADKLQLSPTHSNNDKVSNLISNTGDCDVEMNDKIIQDQDGNSKEDQETVEPSEDSTNTTKEQSTNIISLEEQTAHDKDVCDCQPNATESNIQSNETISLEKCAQSSSNDKDKEVSETADPSINEVAEDKRDNNKAKNILSDLMEMSGISAEDVTPAPVVTTQPEDEIAQSAPNQILLPDTAQALETGIDKNTSEFSPIMSFAELKYACMKNGLFFKLDYETGSIAPINVCIKKHGNNKTPTVKVPESVTIDLTDEEISEKKSMPPKPTAARSLLIASQKENYVDRVSKAKPLKLFKSVHPSILRRTNKPNVFALKTMESFKKIPKLIHFKRKQDLINVDARIDMVDSDCPMEEEYLESSASEGESRKREAESSNDSSDDEPLSKVAKRMRNDGTSDKSNSDAVNTNVVDEEIENLSIFFDDKSVEEEPGGDCILGV